MIRSEIKKLQYHSNTEAAKMSTLSSGKIDKYEYLTGEDKFRTNLVKSLLNGLKYYLRSKNRMLLMVVKQVSISN